MAALWLLIRLRAKAILRKWGRSLRTPKGIFLAVFTLGFFALIIAPSLVVSFTEKRIQTISFLEYGPFFILGFLVFNLVTSAGEKAIYFSPSEVDFLFTAPFSRRQILLYKLAGVVVASLLLAFFMTMGMAYGIPNLVYGFLGMFLTMLFISFASMFIALAGQLLSEHTLARTRFILGAVFATAAIIGITLYAPNIRSFTFDNMGQMAREFSSSQLGTYVLAPLNIFVGAVTSETGTEFVTYAIGAFGINVALVALIMALDVNYLETASRISQQIFSKVQRMRQTGGWSVKAPKRSSRWRLTMLPHWFGVGPLAWRQLLTALRTGSSILLIAGILIVCVSIPIMVDQSLVRTNKLIGIVFGGLAYITLIFSLNLPMGFRSETDHIQVLKALPVSCLAVTIGQLVGPVFIVTLFQWAVLAFVSCATGHFSPWWLVGGSFVLPLNVVVFGIANGLFLVYPVRMQVGSKDVQVVGLMILFMTLQVLGLVFIFGVIGGTGALVYFLSQNKLATYLVTWLMLVICSIGCVLWTAHAFRKFDVSQKLE